MQHFDPNYSAASLASLVPMPELDDYIIILRGHLSSLRKQIRNQAKFYGEQASEETIAQAFTHYILQAWWEERCLGYGSAPVLREPWFVVPPLGLDSRTQNFLVSYGRQSAYCPIPEAAYQIGLLYTSLLPFSLRREKSLFYTPPVLAQKLVEMAANAGASLTADRILEPSCGGGVMLTTVLLDMAREMGEVTATSFLEDVSKRLVGYEMEPFGAWLAQVMVDGALLIFTLMAGTDLPILVQRRDTLKPVGENKFDLVIGNPPYGRVKLDSKQKERFERSISGHANIYKLFFDQATQMLSETGRICYVTPASFLSGAYARGLRSVLREDVQPEHICFLEQRRGVFNDVNQSVVLSSYRRDGTPDDIDVDCLKLDLDDNLETTTLGRFKLPENSDAAWILPRDPFQASLMSRLVQLTSTLEDWGYEVHTGPLIWNRFKDRLSSTPQPGSVPLIWAEAIRHEGTFQWRAKRKKGKRWFRLEPDEDSLMCTSPCILVQRTTSPEQNRRLVLATLPEKILHEHGSVVVENHVNIIRPNTPEPAVTMDTVCAFLSCEGADELFRCLSSSTSVSVSDLRTLPLPCPDNLSTFSAMVQNGAAHDDLEQECWHIIHDA